MRSPGGFFSPPCCEALQTILPDRFQHQQARLLTSFPCLLHAFQQTLVNERGYAVQYLPLPVVRQSTHGFCCQEGAATNKDGEPPEEPLFPGIEQLIAPLDGVTQGLLSCWHIPRPTRQHGQPPTQARQQERRRQQFHASRC